MSALKISPPASFQLPAASEANETSAPKVTESPSQDQNSKTENPASTAEQLKKAAAMRRLEQNIGILPRISDLQNGLAPKPESSPQINHDHQYQHNQTDLDFDESHLVRLDPAVSTPDGKLSYSTGSKSDPERERK